MIHIIITICFALAVFVIAITLEVATRRFFKQTIDTIELLQKIKKTMRGE